MADRELSHRELTVSVKAPCSECGGRGYLETVEAGHIVPHPTEECLACSGNGWIADDMPLSQFRAMLESG
jgi:DnaJ-class molecular chaperone